MPRDSLRTRLRRGLGAMLAAAVAVLVICHAEPGDVTLIVLVALAAAGLLALSILSFGDDVLLGVLALIVAVMTPFAIAAITETPLVGRILAVPVAEAPAHPWAAGFVLDDATLRPEVMRLTTVTIPGRRSSTTETFRFAALVGPGWQRDQPIAAFVRLQRDWPAPPPGQTVAVLRLLHSDNLTKALTQSLGDSRLAAVPQRIIGRIVADPAQARRNAWVKLSLVLGGLMGAWTLLLLVAEWRAGRRQPARPTRPARMARRKQAGG